MPKDKIPELARPPAKAPRARRDQIDVQAWESGLLALAHRYYPAVMWWHGYREAEDRFGSYCYVCERFIVTWAGRWGPPVAAKNAIHQHKLDHRSGKLSGVKITE